MLILYCVLFCIIFKYVILMEGSTEKNELEDKMKALEISKPPITSNSILKEVERFYLDYLFYSKVRDSVCPLPRTKKNTLCELIFQQIPYKSIGIQINKTASFTYSMKCEKHFVEFKTKSMFIEDQIYQEMYPCYGIHNPIRTNYRVDDYFDKFYVSIGKTQNSVIVYIREFDGQYDRFYNYCYHENIDLEELPETKINVKEIQTELQEQPDTFITNSVEEIEKIYLQEMEFGQEDNICNLPRLIKNSLCREVLENHIFKSMGIVMNMAAHYAFEPICQKSFITFRYVEHFRNRRILQQMFPCFCRGISETKNVFKDRFLKKFFLSEGPRKNSVLVYYRNIQNDIDFNNYYYHLHQLLENVYTNDLQPTVITRKNVKNESPYSPQIIGRMEKLIQEHSYTDTIRIGQLQAWVKQEIEYSVTNYLLKLQLPNNLYQAAIKKKQKLFSVIFSIIGDEDGIYKQKEYYTITGEKPFNEELMLDNVRKARYNLKLFYKERQKVAIQSGRPLRANDIPVYVQQIQFLFKYLDPEMVNKILEEISKILLDVINETS